MFKSKLYWRVQPIGGLNEPIIRAMYELYATYYEQTSFKVFAEDLRRKTDVILLFDREAGELQGFSTLVAFNLTQAQRSVRCVFSGDTIIHERFWGQRSLGIAFLLYMFRKKLAHPFVPLYWFLISKGYKTYLLMANNFKDHYPRYECATPEPLLRLMEQASERLFPGCYRAAGTLVFPEEKAARLKVGIADIDQRLLSHPRIKFFDEKNPRWRDGEELVCLAEMSLKMPFHYYHKSILKLWPSAKRRRPFAVRKNINGTVP